MVRKWIWRNYYPESIPLRFRRCKLKLSSPAVGIHFLTYKVLLKRLINKTASLFFFNLFDQKGFLIKGKLKIRPTECLKAAARSMTSKASRIFYILESKPLWKPNKFWNKRCRQKYTLPKWPKNCGPLRNNYPLNSWELDFCAKLQICKTRYWKRKLHSILKNKF